MARLTLDTAKKYTPAKRTKSAPTKKRNRTPRKKSGR